MGSFLRGSACYFSEKNNKFYLVAPNSFAEKLLNSDKNIKSVFDAMVLSDVEISNASQINVTSKKVSDLASDLDEFE